MFMISLQNFAFSIAFLLTILSHVCLQVHDINSQFNSHLHYFRILKLAQYQLKLYHLRNVTTHFFNFFTCNIITIIVFHPKTFPKYSRSASHFYHLAIVSWKDITYIISLSYIMSIETLSVIWYLLYNITSIINCITSLRKQITQTQFQLEHYLSYKITS